MKKWITSAAILAAAFFAYAVPPAHAAEGAGAEHGSWMLLTFFAINFVLFVSILISFCRSSVAEIFRRSRRHDSHCAVTRAERAGRGRGHRQQSGGADGRALGGVEASCRRARAGNCFPNRQGQRAGEIDCRKNPSRHRAESLRAVGSRQASPARAVGRVGRDARARSDQPQFSAERPAPAYRRLHGEARHR